MDINFNIAKQLFRLVLILEDGEYKIISATRTKEHIPNYAGSIAAVYCVVDFLKNKAYDTQVIPTIIKTDTPYTLWTCNIRQSGITVATANAKTMPESICLASLELIK
jgi:Phage ABA sandwich domain